MFIASEDISFILIDNILQIDKSTEGEREIGGRERSIEREAKSRDGARRKFRGV